MARLSLTDTTVRLNESERNINHLQENRKSLLQELKAAKEVLISSLKNVHDLELESRKVPKLEAKIHHLENKIAQQRYMSGDQVLSDSEPEESKLVNQSIEDLDRLEHELAEMLEVPTTILCSTCKEAAAQRMVDQLDRTRRDRFRVDLREGRRPQQVTIS